MKNLNLKILVQKLVKEAITNKLGEGQPVGGVKNDHEFDAGRHGVMKAVNIGEGLHEERPCDCGSGLMSRWEVDGQGIPLVRACDKCRKKKLARYRPEILRPYTQADVDEPIEPDEPDFDSSGGGLYEKIGFDGKYVDDMESGTQTKRIEKLDEDDVNNPRHPWKEIDNGFFRIDERLAKQLAGGKLPQPGYEKLVKAPEGFKSEKGFVWLSQTVLHSLPVWAIRDSRGWELSGKHAVLSNRHLEEGEEQDSKKISKQIRSKELVPYYPENFKEVKNYIRIKKK